MWFVIRVAVAKVAVQWSVLCPVQLSCVLFRFNLELDPTPDSQVFASVDWSSTTLCGLDLVVASDTATPHQHQ